MRLRLVESLSWPGKAGAPNDDAFCAGDTLAAVLDGSTGLGGRLLGVRSDAAWLAGCAAGRLLHHADAEAGVGRALLRTALADVERRFITERYRPPAERYELPMAALMMVQVTGPATLTALWLADCGLIVQRPGAAAEVVGEAFDRRADEGEAAARLAAALGANPVGDMNRPEFLAFLRTARNRNNTDGGPWVLAPDVRCADHACEAKIDAPAGTWLLLASDGFLALVNDYQRYDTAGLMDAGHAQGLEPLMHELRSIEDADPEGRRYPRFKKSDDATAVLLQVE